MATTRSAGRVPNSRPSASTAATATRAAVPRQPACTAATTPRDLIRHQERNAVGGANGDGNVRRIRDEHVGLGSRLRQRVIPFARRRHCPSVNLRDHRHVASADGLGEIAELCRQRQLQLARRKQVRGMDGKRAQRSAAPHDSSVHVETAGQRRQARVGWSRHMTIIGTGLDATEIDRIERGDQPLR